MTSFCQYGNSQQFHFRLLFAALLATGLSTAAIAANSAANSDVDVAIDEAKLIQLDRPPADIIVGNPSIADVAVQSRKLLVITGKSFGRTNIIVIDADGKEIINKILSVEEARTGLVTLHRGTAPFTYYCAPNCTSALAIGDFPDHFKDIAEQIKTKQGLGQSQAEGGGPPQ
jgi:Flp pilus assembly secretin CpaC